ncbi:Pimeloyl-ACP methyl ester carboxylesterase [Tranquillimonas rosea]|uniref:Pimeloyl-ACP methyl ester carboxylesterase n=1 Tax=Tranquillimonas rosea TaxID=641238 RepID=A0A1H9P8Q6_9RHOB|nr:alpha/beta fold hydrolase [Tranquillimonas rosea]SER44179.1 Pimeloyl-ACP methyl ester carboxylesterase [Tranquillimonas rosea]
MAAEPAFVTVDGRPVAYLDEGPRDGAPVVLLHGGGIDRARRSWRETLPTLTGTYRAIAPDLPGYGDSASLGPVQDLGTLGGWLAGFLEAVSAPPAHVVGNSMGGGMGLWLAVHAPERVRSLVLVGSYGLAPRAPVHPLLWLWTKGPGGAMIPRLVARRRLAARAALTGVFRRPSRVTGALVDEMHDEARVQARNQAFRAFLRGEVAPWRYRTTFGDRLDRITCPVLVVHGKGDRLIGWRHARRAAQALPHGELLLMDAGHWPMREAPQDFTAALGNFLERVSH